NKITKIADISKILNISYSVYFIPLFFYSLIWLRYMKNLDK
ncbi:putative membrane protein, partial [Plasmodium reichenowi]